MASLADLTQKQWAAGCKKLGLIVNKRRGKGGHYRVYDPEHECKPLTIPHDTHLGINKGMYKQLKTQFGFSDSEIKKALKLH